MLKGIAQSIQSLTITKPTVTNVEVSLVPSTGNQAVCYIEVCHTHIL